MGGFTAHPLTTGRKTAGTIDAPRAFNVGVASGNILNFANSDDDDRVPIDANWDNPKLTIDVDLCQTDFARDGGYFADTPQMPSD
jgi:hypothetical protein